jgi:transposase-like protein
MSRKPPADELGSFRSRGHGSKFSRKKEAAVAALLSQRNVEEAARIAGIGTQTLHRWMKDPEFRAAWLEARRSAVAQSSARLQHATSAAASTLLKIMVDPSTPASTRVRACDSVLDRSQRALESDDVQLRLAALEHAVILGKSRKGTK